MQNQNGPLSYRCIRHRVQISYPSKLNNCVVTVTCVIHRYSPIVLYHTDIYTRIVLHTNLHGKQIFAWSMMKSVDSFNTYVWKSLPCHHQSRVIIMRLLSSRLPVVQHEDVDAIILSNFKLYGKTTLVRNTAAFIAAFTKICACWIHALWGLRWFSIRRSISIFRVAKGPLCTQCKLPEIVFRKLTGLLGPVSPADHQVAHTDIQPHNPLQSRYWPHEKGILELTDMDVNLLCSCVNYIYIY